MAIRLTESRLRRIVREEVSKLSRRPSQRLSEMPIRGDRYFTPAGEDMGDLADVEYDVMSYITSDPDMVGRIDFEDEMQNVPLVKAAARAVGYPDLSPAFIRNIAAALLDFEG